MAESEILLWAEAEIKRRMELRTKQLALQPLSGTAGGWWPVLREPYPGAWQRNDPVTADTVLAYGAVFSCVTLIASDIAKLSLRLVQRDSDGIWSETESAAFSPVLRRPNRFQDTIKFVESWLISKLTQGNTYVLKSRDQRGVVTAMYVLDPLRVTPLVALDGSIYYELRRDQLSGQRQDTITVPASEIIHDRGPCLYHPLIGVTPITACGIAALQGMAIQNNSKTLFSNGAIPGGILTAPGHIGDDTVARLKDTWQANFGGANVGKVAVLGDGLKYEGMAYNAVDAQLIEQLKWTGENVCSCYHVPPYMVDIGPPPPYANVGPLIQKYYSQCIQILSTSFENCLDEGLGLNVKIDGKQYGTEFDVDDLMWMDSSARTDAAQKGIGSGGMSPNEARKRYFGLGPVAGGESPMVQQQYYSLEALAERDANKPFAKPAQPAPVSAPPQDDNLARAASFAAALHKKALEAGLYAA